MSNGFDWEASKGNLLDYLLAGDSEKAVALAKDTLAQGVTPVEFFEKCISPALMEIGNRFETLDIFLPEMVVAAEIVQQINDEVITPSVRESSGEMAGSLGKVLIATVQGDLHDIGKNMVALMLRVNGFEVYDIGINVPSEEIVAQAELKQVDIIGMSSLLTTCLPYMQDVFNYLEGKGKRDHYAVIMGGAAPTPDFATQVGADGFGHSAAEAVTLCKQIMQKRR